MIEVEALLVGALLVLSPLAGLALLLDFTVIPMCLRFVRR